MIVAIILTLVGLGFVLAEVFFPSLGLFSIIAGGLILGADIAAFNEGTAVGWAFVITQVFLIPFVVWLGFKVLPNTPFGKQMMLEGPTSDPGAGLPDLEPYEGKAGVALTDLRPAGMARIDGDRMSVVSVGGMIDTGTRLVVVSVEGSEVRVRQAPAEESQPAP